MFAPRPDGRFDVNLAPDSKQALVSLAGELEEVQSTDRPETRRLFPTAYPDDPERDAGYQIFARDLLIEKRRAAVAVMRDTVDADVLTEEQLGAWMGVLNDLRLVLGTILDVSEEDESLDPESPNFDTRLLYHHLGEIVHHMVDALTNNLPEPDDDDLTTL